MKKLAVMFLLFMFTNAQVINLKQGWNNVGIVADTNIDDFNNTNIVYIWEFKNSSWYFYSPNENVLDFVKNLSYNIMDNIVSQGSALWIYSSNDVELVTNPILYSSVSGVVKDSINYNVLNNFTVIVDGNNSVEFNNSAGEFQISSLTLGEHNLSFVAEGYQTLNMNINIQNSNTINLGQIYMIPDTAVTDINLSGKILNAATGEMIPNAHIQIFAGYNNYDGQAIYDYVSPDGFYSTEIESGAYSVLISADGFYTSNYNYTFSTDYGDSIVQDFTLVPQQADDYNTTLRAVLTWGAEPTDLDAHLVALDTQDSQILWHVYYSSPVYYENNVTVANLDVDDTSSYGPETITLNDVNDSVVYKYFVYNFSGSPDLKDSNAHVVVIYKGDEYDFQVPNEDGIVWKVFEIQNGELIPCVNGCMSDLNMNYSDYETFYNLKTISNGDGKALNEVINSYIGGK